MVTWRNKISLLVLKNISLARYTQRVKYFSTLEATFHISAWPCNILYESRIIILKEILSNNFHFSKERDTVSGQSDRQFSSVISAL